MNKMWWIIGSQYKSMINLLLYIVIIARDRHHPMLQQSRMISKAPPYALNNLINIGVVMVFMCLMDLSRKVLNIIKIMKRRLFAVFKYQEIQNELWHSTRTFWISFLCWIYCNKSQYLNPNTFEVTQNRVSCITLAHDFSSKFQTCFLNLIMST